MARSALVPLLTALTWACGSSPDASSSETSGSSTASTSSTDEGTTGSSSSSDTSGASTTRAADESSSGSSTGESVAWGWAEHRDGSGSEDQVLGVAVTADGGTVWAGRVSGDWQADAHRGASDLAIGMLDNDGQSILEVQLGSDGIDVALDVDLLAGGDIVVGGVTTGDLFGEANPSPNDGFVARVDRAGNLVWGRLLGLGTVNQIAPTPDGGVVAVGSASSATGAQAFAVELSAEGETLWSEAFGASGISSATDVAFLQDDRLVITGFTDDALDGETPLGGLDGFVVHMERGSGERRTTRLLGGSDEDSLVRVQVRDEATWVAGWTSSALEEAAGGVDVFVTRLDADGETTLLRQYGTMGNEAPYGLALSDDLVLLSGRIDETAWQEAPLGQGDAFILAIDPATGDRQWVVQEGGGGRDEHVALTVWNEVLVTGGYLGDTTSPSASELWLTARRLD